MGDWNNRKYPLGCRSCGRSDVGHMGLGLCNRCYRSPEINKAAKEGTLVEFDFTSLVSPKDDESRADDSDWRPEGSNGEVGFDEFEDWPASSSRERRPGSFTSPVSESSDAPVAPTKKGLRGLFDKAKQVTAPKKTKVFAPETREKAPKGAGRRVSTSETMEDAWKGLGGLAMRTGHAPLGRYLQWQSVAAGEMLDQAVAGTIIDKRLLQPAVRARSRFDVIGALVGPPLIILQIERNPAQAEVLFPILKSAIRSSLPTMLPAMKKAQVREEKVAAAVAEMFPDLPAGVDPVDLILEQLFYGYTPDSPIPQPAAQESDAASAA